MSDKKFIFLLTLIILPLTFIDRFSKIFIREKLLEPTGVFLVKTPPVDIQISSSLNSKLAFSLPLPQTITMILAGLLIVLLLLFCFQKIKQRQLFYAGTVLLIAIMALSNLVDRILYGGVIDFLAIRIFNLNWATFNLADALITLGIITLIILELKSKPKHI